MKPLIIWQLMKNGDLEKMKNINFDKREKERAVVLFSGGQDSTTCLFWAKKKFEDVLAVSFDYGQKHVKELDCAKEICEQNNIKHMIVDISVLKKFRGENNNIAGRNLFFVAFGAEIAKKNNIKNIVLGVSQQDLGDFPDCRDNFVKSLNLTINLGMDYDFSIITPLICLDKIQTWKLANDLGIFDIILDHTLTCYNGIKGVGCGTCLACKQRNLGYINYTKKGRGTDA